MRYKLAEKAAGKIIDMIKSITTIRQCWIDRNGKTEGVFQLESAGMKNFMKELKPQSLEDVIAGISLYRPGPMDFIPQYIKGKNNPDRSRMTARSWSRSWTDLRLYRLSGTGYADRA